MNLISLGVAVVVSGVTSLLLARYLSVKMRQLGITGQDNHKVDKRVTAEMGGLAVLVAMFPAVLVLYALGFGVDETSVLILATLSLVGVIGIVDDTVGVRQRYKPFLVAAASFPLAYLLIGRTTMALPIIGYVPLGLLYPLVIVPVAVATSANFANLLAGFNGLETGIAVVGLFTVSGMAWFNGAQEVAALGFILTAAFAGLLALNWYPAKIFPGDTGTLLAGAAIATVGLAGGVETAAIILSVPAALDFTLKALTRRPFQGRKDHGNTTVDPSGLLSPPPYPALAHAFMRVGVVREKDVVRSLLGMELLYAVLAVVGQLWALQLLGGIL